jgi:glutamine synthetase
VLVRIPLGWTTGSDMMAMANPKEQPSHRDLSDKQTVELRSPDGSADLYQLLAGLCVACRHGFEMVDALELAQRTYVDVNIHDAQNVDRLKGLKQLPDSCAASADCLERQRYVFEQYGVFTPAMIDGIISELKAFDDADLRSRVANEPELLQQMVERYFQCG